MGEALFWIVLTCVAALWGDAVGATFDLLRLPDGFFCGLTGLCL